MNYQSWKSVLTRPCSGTIVKRCPLTLWAAENICSTNGDYTKAITQIHHTELVCALLFRRFYTSDFEKETEKRENTQVHCIKGHTVAHIRQELWRHSKKISFLVDKHDAGMPYVYISNQEETGSVLPFLVSQFTWYFGKVQTNEVCYIF